jgi:DNA-binding CsgD family transcriptional regulator
MPDLDMLTPRDRQVVNLLIQGCSNPDIGVEMGISTQTVKQHLNFIGLRLGLGVVRHPNRFRIALVRRFGNFPEPDVLTTPTAWDALSDNQREAVRLVADNLSNREIGERLGWTENTTKMMLRRVFDKLGMFSRLELTVWYGRIFGFAKESGNNGKAGESIG